MTRSTILTGLTAVAAGAAAAVSAWSLGAGHERIAVLPVALVLGLVVAALAVTRFGAYVLLMLAARPMVDLVKLSGPTAGEAGVDGEGGISRNLDPSTLLAVLFLVAAGLWLASRARQEGRLRTSPLGVALLLVGATGLISALGADQASNSLLEALRILTVVVMFVVLEQLVPDERYARRVLLAVYLALAVVLAYTLLASLTGNPPAEVKGSFVRISGPFAQSTTFGRYLMFLLVFGVAVFRYLTGRLRLAMGGLLGLSFLFLMLTNTRSAILGVAIGLLVVALVQRSAKMLVALGLIAVLGVAFLPASLYNAAGAPIRTDPTGRAGTYVGDEIDVAINLILNPHTDWQFGASHFWAGPYVERTATTPAQARDGSFFYAQFVFRF